MSLGQIGLVRLNRESNAYGCEADLVSHRDIGVGCYDLGACMVQVFDNGK